MFLKNAIQPVTDQQVTAYMSGFDRFFHVAFIKPVQRAENIQLLIELDQTRSVCGWGEIRNNLF